MADFYSIPLEEMDAFLRSRRFQPVDLTYRNRPVMEWVYERPLPRQPNHFVRVYTGINRYGRSQNQSRGAGKDAIRVQVIYKSGDVETLVTQPKRVHRVTGWADNLDNRLSEIAQSLPQVVFDRRGEPMTLRRKNGKYFWGSRDYPRYKETRPFQAEEFNGEMEEYAYGDVDDGFTSMSNLAHISLPDYEESYYWTSVDGNSRATVAYDEDNEVIIIPNFEVSLRVRGKKMAHKYLEEIIDDTYRDGYSVQVTDVDNHAIGFWEKMQSQGLIESWTQGSFAAEGAPLSGQTTEAPYEIKVYVPSTTLDQPISASDFKSRIDETQEKLSELFGGFTTVDASGGYLSQQDGVISEPVIVVSSWATEEDYQSKLGDLERFLKQKKDDWGQEVIGFEFENDFFMYPAFEAEDEIPIIDLNSKKEIEEYGLFRPYEPNPWHREEWRRKSLTDAPENSNLFRINCDGVYAVRTIYGPSKIIFGRNMLASNKVSFNRAEQRNLSGVWGLMGLPRDNSGVVSAFGPLENIEKMPQFSERPAIYLLNKKELIPNRIVINMKGLVFAYDIVHREVEFYGGVPQSSIVSEDIPPEWVNPQEISKPLFAAEDDYDSTYGVEQAKIRRRLKNKIKKQAIMGTKAGQWSARKSQELKRQYEAACDKKGLNSYKGKKTKSQDNLSKWSKQKWGTASGKKSSTTGEPYFPAKAVAALKDKGLYSKAKQQKKAATKAGKQNARYSDDIRAVVKNYRSETYEEATGVEFSEQNPEKIEADAPPDWRESIITIPQSDSFGYALYRKMSDLTYNQVWRVLELIDDLNRMSHHHALTRFSSNYVEIWIYSHDSGLVMPKDYHWAEDFNDMIATVDWQMWESETEWEEVDWEKEKPAKDQNDWGDDVEWEAEDDWGSLRPETRPEFPTVDAKIASMLRNHSKVNVNGEQGCPRCGQEDLFYRESTGTGTKWYCYGCFYTEKTESQKSQKIITLEKYGLKVRCPDCDEMIVAYNQASLNSHRKKCGVTK